MAKVKSHETRMLSVTVTGSNVIISICKPPHKMVGWLGFNGTFRINRLYSAIKNLTFIEDVYFRYVWFRNVG